MAMRALPFVAILAACSTSPSPGSPNGESATSPDGAAPGADPNDSGSKLGFDASGTKGEAGTDAANAQEGSAPTTGRDWSAYPAIADLPAPPVLYALSDVHGAYDRLSALLLANAIVTRAPTTATDAHWGAGNATLVVTGDMIDKGPSSVEVIDFLMALQADAKTAGGVVVVTLGNHEAEFLVNPMNSKASGPDGIDPELLSKGLMPASLASGSDPRGAWLRRLPFGARVGSWFFSHAGDTQGRTVAVLESTLQTAVKAHADYDDPEIVGASSILESRAWYTAKATASTNAAALNVKHIVFGHDPSALGARGTIAVGPGNVLLRIDCGMSPVVGDSHGMLLRVTLQGATDVVDALGPGGQAITPLFQAPH